VTDQADVQTLDFATLVAIADRDPVEAARLITAKAKAKGNLTSDEARLRRTCLHRARITDGRKVSWLADRVGIAMSGISRLTKPKPSVLAEEAAA
jgi:hypothetical protein